MPDTRIWLTDEASDLFGYRRARVGARSDSPSLVRNGSTAGPMNVNWITDPLDGPLITAQPWIFHVWATSSSSQILTLQTTQFTNIEQTQLVQYGIVLPTARHDNPVTTGPSWSIQLDVNDRIVINLSCPGPVELSYNGMFPNAEGDTYLIIHDVIELAYSLPEEVSLDIRMLLKDLSDTNPQLTRTEIERQYQMALVTYSQARPLITGEFYSGDGATYQFSLPRLWIDGLSDVFSLEYPAGQNPRSMLDKSDDWGIYQTWLGVQPVSKLWISSIPQAGTDNIQIAYTTKHIHSLDVCTVPYLDRQAILWLAASYLARNMSARGASYTDNTIEADAVNYRDMETRWKDVAEQYNQRYHDYIFGSKEGDNAASGRDDWDTTDMYRRDYIFHPRRFR